jgi:RNA polymerase sigma-70 factor, ECF subfamily
MMETLGRRLARGDQASFAELYDLCAARCHHYLTSFLGSRDAADDVLQETFLRLVLNRRRLARVDDLMAYVFIVARNEAMRSLRRGLRREKRPLALFSGKFFVEGTSDDLCKRETAEVVSRAVSELTAEQREVIQLKVYSGLTFRQIAEIMGVPLATAATRYRTALERLREKLARQLQ